ncbi:helix-turn-helix domain-containing protein [Klenkia brasiliensis]|uniref:Helix-turn-helix domain-containing protein n=1 Tax=Klenkia brasiliensis TaxID=333142 RepID=A0A1G8AAP8_9ACTN|nr:AraC family transcriptional regulator [Klenkia brasiliensis]SDH17957.1 Helix-turn-helix domain-containing protein [Klenkia brasiliensis]
MASPPDVPVTRTAFESTSSDDAWDALSRMYSRGRPHLESGAASVRLSTAATPAMDVDTATLTPAGGAFDPNPDQLNIITVLDGWVTLDHGRAGTVTTHAESAYLHLPDHRADLRWGQLEALPVRLPTSHVARVVAEQTGMRPEDLRFTSARPLSDEHARLWVRTARALFRELGDPAVSSVNALVHLALVDLAAAAAAEVFPNTAMTRGYVAGPGDVRPPAVRRAVAFMDSHASLPITLTDIADAAGTVPHALVHAFRRHDGTTPLDHLGRARLAAAHDDLRQAGPGAGSVDVVAARWGFPGPAEFRVAYAAEYGHPPAPAG